jgi:hypothetical protein
LRRRGWKVNPKRVYGIKFRPLKPASPHLNDTVERSQRTDLEEFYATDDPSAADLNARLASWQEPFPVTWIVIWPHTMGKVAGTGRSNSLLGRCRSQLRWLACGAADLPLMPLANSFETVSGWFITK